MLKGQKNSEVPPLHSFQRLHWLRLDLTETPSKIHAECSSRWIEPDELWQDGSGAEHQSAGTVYQVASEIPAEALSQ